MCKELIRWILKNIGLFLFIKKVYNTRNNKAEAIAEEFHENFGQNKS